MAEADAERVKATPRRKRPREQANIPSADPVEIAMAAADESGARGTAARRLLEAHERLALTQTELAGNELLRARIRTARDISIALLALALLLSIVAAVIGASRSRAIVIGAFSVPPELAQRGLGGEVVAQRFLDRLGMIQRRSDSVRAPASFANAWSGDLRVQIPTTGVSLGEANRLLRRWLGSETYVSGEVFRTATGFVVAVRTTGLDPIELTGGPTELEPMLQGAAEQAFAQQQPYLFSIYLQSIGRNEEALAIGQRLAASGDPGERAWGFNTWGFRLIRDGRLDEAAARLRAGLSLNPDLAPLRFNLMSTELARGRDGAAFRLLPAASESYARAASRRTLKEDSVASIRTWIAGMQAEMRADYGGAARHASQLLQLVNYTNTHGAAGPWTASSLAAQHRPSDAVATLASQPLSGEQLTLTAFTASLGERLAGARIKIAAEREDWAEVLREAEALDRWQQQRGGLDAVRRNVFAVPWAARARAELGDAVGAAAIAARAPADCYFCVATRGFVAAKAGRHREAEQWFARGTTLARELPFAWFEWGLARLGRGDAAGATPMFEAAAARAPRWADPLKHQGDALVRLRRPDEAERNYGEAAERAPQWGALHLAWADALWRLGRRDEARGKLRAAAGMDLNPEERSRLQQMWRVAKTAA
jgi:tetratricopeptide (TPR) repeat protein